MSRATTTLVTPRRRARGAAVRRSDYSAHGLTTRRWRRTPGRCAWRGFATRPSQLRRRQQRRSPRRFPSRSPRASSRSGALLMDGIDPSKRRLESPQQETSMIDLTISFSLSLLFLRTAPSFYSGRENSGILPLARGILPLSGTMQQVSSRPATSVLSPFSLTQLHAAGSSSPQVSRLSSRCLVPQLG